MQISTKTLTSLLLMTTAAMKPGGSRLQKGWRKKSRFERLLQRHDRKGELRAEVLGTSPEDFRFLQKQFTFDEVVRRHGFLNEQAFHTALIGKIRSELRRRGWSGHRIDSYVVSRSDRVGSM